jgi:hypothetical protein
MLCISLDFLLGNNFFYVNHMVLVYLVNKPHVSRRITRCLLLLLEYEFANLTEHM